jgi:hypothetical protein
LRPSLDKRSRSQALPLPNFGAPRRFCQVQ